MKRLFTISLLMLSAVLHAQTNDPVKPANSNPNISISPAASTTITNQPASMPNSNTNPTTGTVIKLKSKDASKAKPQNTSQNKSPRKRTNKKNKI